LAGRGASVAVHYHARAEAAEAVARAIEDAGGRAVALQADLSRTDECVGLTEEASRSLGAIDILVNNAGEMTDAAVLDMPEAEWQRALALHLTAAFLCSQGCLFSMIERRWGRIINLSSQAALTGSARHAHYAAAKAGLLGLTYSLAKEVAGYGITVNAVVPGRILTDMIADRSEGRLEEWLRQTPIGRLGAAEEVAAAIAFLASPGASYITGATLNVSGGQYMG
jgi:3-oxoacyl-[acyl-carrier protein] reductase